MEKLLPRRTYYIERNHSVLLIVDKDTSHVITGSLKRDIWESENGVLYSGTNALIHGRFVWTMGLSDIGISRRMARHHDRRTRR